MTDDRTDGRAAPGWTPRMGWKPRRGMEDAYADLGTDRATEVLVIAQRTAEEHIRSVRLEAESIHARAMSSAGEIVRDAEAYAEDLRRQAEHILAEAKTTAESIRRDARDKADERENRAMTILSEARSRAKQIGAEARLGAEDLRRQAVTELDRLQAERESLLRQIESLHEFDREYRLRLLGFMQGQMRALWADNPELMRDPDEMPPDSEDQLRS